MLVDKVREYSLKELVTPNTRSILLVGSAVYKRETEFNDIDILILQDNQNQPIQNKEIPFNSTVLDIWTHDIDYFRSTINMVANDLNEVENISLYISLLSNAVVWYDDGSTINLYIDRVKNWKWKKEYTKFLNIKVKQPVFLWAKQAVKEDLILLDKIKENLKKGKPISHRRKDYPGLIIPANKDQVKLAAESIKDIFQSMGIKREWTEWKDTKKYIQKNDWDKALASIKDVLRFIARNMIKNTPEQILDPNIWFFAEEQLTEQKLLEVVSIVFK